MLSEPLSETTKPDALSILQREIETSRKERLPTSRHRIAEVVAKETGLAFRDALLEVEAYCDTREPGIPEYLSTEFGMFWLKVLGVANVAVGLFLFWNGVGLYRSGKAAWPMWALGTLFCGIAVFFWVRSVEAEVERRN